MRLNQLELTQQQAMAAAMLDQLQVGVIVVDRARCILHANAFARDLLVHGGIAASCDGCLVLECTEADGALWRSIAKTTCVCSDSLSEAALGLHTLWVDDWQVSVSPFIDDGSLNLSPVASEAFLITLRPVERRAESLAVKLASEFRLTPAETLIVEQIVQGGTLQQIAQRKSVSINTIKTHLKSIFFKMGVCSQADLVRAVLARGGADGR
jgi:DNA-binding CsgD family transcriptional regulator